MDQNLTHSPKSWCPRVVHKCISFLTPDRAKPFGKHMKDRVSIGLAARYTTLADPLHQLMGIMPIDLHSFKWLRSASTTFPSTLNPFQERLALLGTP